MGNDQRARPGLLVRAGRISAGLTVTAVGLALLVLPGPGLVTVAAGLSILAVDVPIARRLLGRVRRRLPHDAGGRIPRWAMIAMGGAAAAGASASAVVTLA